MRTTVRNLLDTIGRVGEHLLQGQGVMDNNPAECGLSVLGSKLYLLRGITHADHPRSTRRVRLSIHTGSFEVRRGRANSGGGEIGLPI